MPATILIVDDERDLLDSLRFSLEREGFCALTAQNGSSALSLMGQSPPPDLVLLDWMLPDMAGTEVCRPNDREDTWHAGHHDHRAQLRCCGV